MSTKVKRISVLDPLSDESVTGGRRELQDIDARWKGKGLLFEPNYVEKIDYSESLGQRILGNNIMFTLERYYYRKMAKLSPPIIFASFPLCIMGLASEDPRFRIVATSFCFLSTLFIFGLGLKMNITVLKKIMSSFDSALFFGITPLQGFTAFDLCGWTYDTSVWAIFSISCQLLAILIDALPRSPKKFEEKWAHLIKSREKFHLVDAIESWRTKKSNVSANLRSHRTISHQNELNLDLEHMKSLSDVVRTLLDPHVKWSLLKKIRWQILVIRTFSNRLIIVSYFLGLLYSISIYTAFTTGYARVTFDRSISIYWMRFNMTELMRSAWSTGMFFYMKRLILLILNPIHLTSISSSMIATPIVPEWSIFLDANDAKKYASWMKSQPPNENMNQTQADAGLCQSTGLVEIQNDELKGRSQNSETIFTGTSMDINEEIAKNIDGKISSVCFGETPSPKQGSELVGQRPAPLHVRYPIYLIPSSGRGDLLDMSNPISHECIGLSVHYANWIRNFIKRYFYYIPFIWCIGGVSWFIFLGTGKIRFFFTSAMTLGFSFWSFVFLWMDSVYSMMKLSLSGFETIYLSGNLVVFFWVGSWYLPKGDEVGWVILLSFGFLSFSMLVLDARPAPIRNLRHNLKRVSDGNMNPWILNYLRIIAKELFQHMELHYKFKPKNRGNHLDSQEQNDPSLKSEINIHASVNNPLSQKAKYKRNRNDLANQHRIFGNNRTILVFLGLLPSLILYTMIDFSLITDHHLDSIWFLGIEWRNYSLTKSCLGNLLIFIMRRLYVSIFYPERCLSIQTHSLWVPLTESLAELVLKELD